MNSFRTYWDLSDKERAQLAGDDVEKFLDAELMTKGVLKVTAPQFDPEPAVPELPKQTYYRVRFVGQTDTGVVFSDRASADTFAGLAAFSVDRTYIGGGWSQSVEHVQALHDPEISECQLASHDDFRAHKASIDRAAAVREANRKKRDEFEKTSKEQAKVLEGLWDDWHRCRELDTRMRRTVETFEDYKRVAGGDAAVAARFLLKVFSREQIAEAAAWCGVEIPVPSVAEEFAPPSGAVAVDNFPAEY